MRQENYWKSVRQSSPALHAGKTHQEPFRFHKTSVRVGYLNTILARLRTWSGDRAGTQSKSSECTFRRNLLKSLKKKTWLLITYMKNKTIFIDVSLNLKKIKLSSFGQETENTAAKYTPTRSPRVLCFPSLTEFRNYSLGNSLISCISRVFYSPIGSFHQAKPMRLFRLAKPRWRLKC